MEISPEKWREASIHGIKLAQVILGKSDRDMEATRVIDPLPLLRDACIKQSNDMIRTYMRSTRAVVAKLRRGFVAINDEIKSANRCKESLEKALEHNRKDFTLNDESQDIRALRPAREKDVDGADRLLKSEQSHLVTFKRSLESHLRKLKLHLQELSMLRGRLAAAIQERTRVTDLLCQSMSSSFTNQVPRDGKRPTSTMPSASRQEMELEDMESRALTKSRGSGRHLKAFSAPVPLELGRDPFMHGIGSASMAELDPNVLPGPYDALSTESAQSLYLASESILKSREIRQEAASVIDHTQRLHQAAHDTVNETFIKKIAQTITLTDHLELSGGDTKLALHRSQRHHQAQQKALGYLLGPMMSADVTTRERIDRPLVKVYQRHVGTDLPDAAHLIQATEHYEDSMDTTMKNMALLKLSTKGLQADVKDKKTAAFIDAQVVRLRRRKANHRWVLQGKAYPPKAYANKAALSH